MKIPTANYAEQVKLWPQTGQHILAHFDDDTIIVYQAYSPVIGKFAIKHGYFGGEFKYSRMSWIKPNFLWMMYRSDWGRFQGQEIVLALRLRRAFFDSLLSLAVPSSFASALFSTETDWKTAVERSEVRLQWDPDHLPTGENCQRRAIQIGLRGAALESFGKREIVEIVDMSDFVASQRINAKSWPASELITPTERIYLPTDLGIAQRVGLDLPVGKEHS